MVQQLAAPSEKVETRNPPLLKWTGGKRLLLKHLSPLLPTTSGTYYEPFVGGGAVYFALQPSPAVIADRNPELTNCYVQVRDRPNEVLAALTAWGSSERDYYGIREAVFEDAVFRAARLMYLTRLSFNGIYRLNGRGEFNVPYGHRPHLGSCDPGRVRSASRTLQGARITCSDFEETTRPAEAGDVVYFDPPYALPDDRTRFIRYNDRNFSWLDQVRLAAVAGQLRSRGVKVIVSNADHPELRNLYRDFECLLVTRNSSIAADGKQRGPTTECIFHTEN
jgi:DNA adenine methylase